MTLINELSRNAPRTSPGRRVYHDATISTRDGVRVNVQAEVVDGIHHVAGTLTIGDRTCDPTFFDGPTGAKVGAEVMRAARLLDARDHEHYSVTLHASDDVQVHIGIEQVEGVDRVAFGLTMGDHTCDPIFLDGSTGARIGAEIMRAAHLVETRPAAPRHFA